MTLLTVMKGLPLAYDKDMQEDKECVFDAIDTVTMCLKVLPDMLSTMTVLTENMAAAGRKGFINATDCADYLTKKGCPSGMPTNSPAVWWPAAYRKAVHWSS